MTSAKCSDFFIPSRLSAFSTDIQYRVHTTSLTSSTFGVPPLSSHCGRHMYLAPDYKFSRGSSLHESLDGYASNPGFCGPTNHSCQNQIEPFSLCDFDVCLKLCLAHFCLLHERIQSQWPLRANNGDDQSNVASVQSEK